MMNNKTLHMVAFTLLLVGGVNWGLVALGYNLVDSLLGAWPTAVTVVYALVGVSALWVGATHMKDCKVCSKK